MKKILVMNFCLVIMVFLSACGSTKDIEIIDAYFSRGQSEEELDARENEFYSMDTIYFNIDVKDQPEEGIIEVEFRMHELLINTVEYDFSADTERIEGPIHLYFDLTSDEKFPLSENYRVILSVNGEEYGDYNYAMIPPDDAIASQVNETGFLYLDEVTDEMLETNTFSNDQIVFFYVNADYGTESWIEIAWDAGKDAEDSYIYECGSAAMSEENITGDISFYDCFPDDGWESGEYNVSLFLDDNLVGTYPFTIE